MRLPGHLSALLWNLPYNRRLTAALLAVNLFGTGYGFYWYRDQLAATPVRYWPVVPDSPAATLLFTLFLAAHLAGRRPPYLSALAYLASIKYGLWTPAIMVHYWLTARAATFESVHLSLSHLGMALEALIFMRAAPPARLPVLAAAAWLLFNDYMDYARGFHPYLPVPGPGAVVFAGAAAVVLSLVALGIGLARARPAPEPSPGPAARRGRS